MENHWLTFSSNKLGLSALCVQAFNTSVLQGVQLVPMGDHTVVDQSFCKSEVGQSHTTSFEASNVGTFEVSMEYAFAMYPKQAMQELYKFLPGSHYH